MKRWITIPIGLAIVAATAGSSAAQNPSWAHQFGTSSDEWCYGAAPGGAGDVYVGGWTLGSLGGTSLGFFDAWLARYDSTGGQVWTRQIGTTPYDEVLALATDGAAGVIIAGATRGNLGGPNPFGTAQVFLARYDPAGTQVWLRQIAASSGSNWGSDSKASAADGAGGVFLTGQTYGSFGGQWQGSGDAWFGHFDALGNSIWIRHWGTTGDDWGSGVAPDGSGGVFVSGSYQYGLPNAGGWLARFDAAGNQIWLHQLPSQGLAEDLAVDGLGGVFLLGRSNVAHYDSAGNELWLESVGPNYEDGAALAADGTGGFVIAGGTGPDAWLGRYDASGNLNWESQLGSSASDGATAITVGTAGEIYVGGVTSGNLAGQFAGGLDDIWVVRYDPPPPLVVSLFCTGAGVSCPCANSGANGHGCANSFDPTGGRVQASGVASVSADSVVLTGSNMPDAAALYFQGTAQVNGGSGATFGDGLRCAGGTTVRLGTALNVGGTSHYPSGSDLPVSVRGQVPAGGGVRTYQVWYRNAAPFCTASTFNLSNGLQVTWTP